MVLLEHHDALRMVFRETDNGIIQHNLGLPVQAAIEVFDLRNDANATVTLQDESRRMHSEFDLGNGPLVKLGLFHGDNGSDLVIIIHH